jgi:hypothetical protein
VPDEYHLGIAGAFMCMLDNDTGKSVYDRDEIDKFRNFWKRFHAAKPNLETEFLAFIAKATAEQKTILRKSNVPDGPIRLAEGHWSSGGRRQPPQ